MKSWRHKLKKHILAIVPPYYGIGSSVERATAQQNIEKALNNGNFTFCSYGVTVSFFPLFFIILWNHWQPPSGALEHPEIAAVLDYTFRLKELHPPLGIQHEDQKSKLEHLSIQAFTYAMMMVSNQFYVLTCPNLSMLVQIKYVLNQYKAGVEAEPPQEFSHSEYADDWIQLYNVFNQWSMKLDCINDWH